MLANVSSLSRKKTRYYVVEGLTFTNTKRYRTSEEKYKPHNQAFPPAFRAAWTDLDMPVSNSLANPSQGWLVEPPRLVFSQKQQPNLSRGGNLINFTHSESVEVTNSHGGNNLSWYSTPCTCDPFSFKEVKVIWWRCFAFIASCCCCTQLDLTKRPNTHVRLNWLCGWGLQCLAYE